jgi:hypothetical protein
MAVCAAMPPPRSWTANSTPHVGGSCSETNEQPRRPRFDRPLAAGFDEKQGSLAGSRHLPGARPMVRPPRACRAAPPRLSSPRGARAASRLHPAGCHSLRAALASSRGSGQPLTAHRALEQEGELPAKEEARCPGDRLASRGDLHRCSRWPLGVGRGQGGSGSGSGPRAP